MNKQTMHAGTKTGSGRRAALFAAQGAMVAALYVALTWIASIAGLSSMAIQVRISEALCVLPFFLPAAVPGLFVGCLLANLMTGAVVWDILFGSLHFRRPEQVRKTVNFKREAQRIHREQQNAPYRYKCAVCGRTDADHPELEFRYCSRCAGYHCFCQDHINNHIHFTE